MELCSILFFLWTNYSNYSIIPLFHYSPDEIGMRKAIQFYSNQLNQTQLRCYTLLFSSYLFLRYQETKSYFIRGKIITYVMVLPRITDNDEYLIERKRSIGGIEMPAFPARYRLFVGGRRVQ